MAVKDMSVIKLEAKIKNLAKKVAHLEEERDQLKSKNEEIDTLLRRASEEPEDLTH